jgi:hypothetical protein
VTAGGTPTVGLLLANATVTPPGGAETFSVTVPLIGTPPGHDVTPTHTLSSCRGATVNVADRTLPESMIVAVIVATVGGANCTVVTSKVWLDVPAAIVTLAGTTTFALLLVSETTTPDAAAGAASVTVPVTVPPLVVDAADSVRLSSVRRPIVSVAVWLPPE